MKKTIITLLSFGAALASHAAVISWGTPTDIAGDSDVSLTGTLVYAVNFGAATTINGVSFADNSAQSDVTSTDTGFVASGFLNPAFAGGGANPQSAEYVILLQGGIFEPNNATVQTVVLDNLSIGQAYEVQVWASRSGQPGDVILDEDGTGAAGPGSVTLIDDPGQYVIGSFTADGTSQSFLYGGDNAFSILNGVQVRAVPEPSSALLLGLGGLALLRRRR